ncbi:hypothetical protein OK074_7906 [Actinobacteria bacterium OK074]|nr:hypothetical protein OK074_7906 [Actinobacteria bacterium OK074]
MSTEPPSRAHEGAAPTTPPIPSNDELVRRLGQVLVCAAVDPALCGVLVFDLEPQFLDPVVRAFDAILTGTEAGPETGTDTGADTGAAPDHGSRPSHPVMLGATSRDEDLWIWPALRPEPDGISLRLEPGPLIRTDGRPGPPALVVVPDLARLSIAGMRAGVQLLGADVAVVERAGLRHAARPRARWLAACRSADVGRVSGHLLDRFVVRLPAAGLLLPDPGRLLEALPPAWLDAVARAGRGEYARPVHVTDAAVTQACALTRGEASTYRVLALTRLARTMAGLDGEHTATADHCDAAARLMGLARSGTEPSADPEATDAPHTSSARARRTTVRSDGSGEPRRVTQGEPHRSEAVQPLLESEPAEGIGSAPGGAGTVLVSPYPEDKTDAPRDAVPLRSPWQRTAGPASLRGVAIGTRRARDLRDLAYVRTVREAAVHQHVRRTERFTVSPVDLHSFVRAGVPERMLILVLDHTCHPDWDWQDALAPFLEWAYTERAAVQMIEMGGADAVDELRAESYAARSLLDPRIMPALERKPGRASPLAHGIEQAARALRRAFRKYGSGLAEAWLVVVTDGRGNVPLRASQTGRLEGPVGAAGVEDALLAASDIRSMDRMRVRVAVVDAGREPYGDLPFALGDALGGTVVEGRGAGRGSVPGEGNTGEW